MAASISFDDTLLNGDMPTSSILNDTLLYLCISVLEGLILYSQLLYNILYIYTYLYIFIYI